jgi:endonuclease/exonuclease/phosphatase family metal-dependent hydrolase
MRRSIYIIIGLAALFACKREDPLAPFRDESKFVIPQTGSNITVMTYNIFGASGNTNLDSVATVINAAKPDFVMIQEVDSRTPRSGRNIHQAKVLAEKTGMKYCYQVAWDRGKDVADIPDEKNRGGGFGDAVLSKYEFTDSVKVKIGPDPAIGGQDRAVVFIKVRIEDKDLWVGTTHLDHVANDANRIYQAKAIKPILESLDAPFVFGGDFNDEPGSKTIEIMSQYTTFAYRSVTQYTYPSNLYPYNNKQLIDYVTYFPRDCFIERGYNVLHTVKASDHMPVVAVLNMDY